MKTKEQRRLEQAEKSQAARRLIEDPYVLAWFEAEHAGLVRQMLEAPISDDETRRTKAIEIRVLDSLLKKIQAEAATGKAAQDEYKRTIANE